MYRIKGSGSLRNVLNEEGEVVGSIQRFDSVMEDAHITKKSFTYRKRTVQRWRARWPSGDPVLWVAGHRMITDLMKDWAEPQRWVKWAQPMKETPT